MQGCTNLGILYEAGEGVPYDFARAANLYEQACDGGDVLGCTILRTMQNVRLVGVTVSLLPILLIIALIVCVARRKEEIGGWLLYYHIQLYATVLFTLLSFAALFEAFFPGAWSDAPSLYFFFLIATLPVPVTLIAQLVVAERLRLSRDSRHLVSLKLVLWINLAFFLVATGVDAKFFLEAVAFDLLASDLLSSASVLIWLPYFYRSRRVERVFIDKDWVIPRS